MPRAKSTALSTLEQKLAERIQKAQRNLGSTVSSNIISLSTDGFKYNDRVTESFNCIILGSVFENAYYDRPYDPQQTFDPLCWAVAEETVDLAPPAGHKQAQSKKCDSCQWNEYETKGKGKACRNGRRIAVVAVPDPNDLSTVDVSEVAVIRIAPTSLGAYEKYEHEIFRVRQNDPVQYVTEFAIDDTSAYPKIKVPKPVLLYDQPELMFRLVERGPQTIEMLMNVGYTLDPEPYVAPRGKRRSRLG